MIWANWAKSLLQALLTPAIAVATYFLSRAAVGIQRRQAKIAEQQAETNKLQYRLALFDRRMKVFDATTALFTEILKDAKVDLPQLYNFYGKAREHELLFGLEVKTYPDEVFRKGLELRTIGVTRKPEDSQKEFDLLNWFDDQRKGVTEVFLKYLDFRKP
jgi:hypothetical protein